MDYNKKVEWCLTKASKGLKKVEPNVRAAKKHIITARESLQACNFMEKSNFSKWCASTIFYCVYHCFLAVLAKEGYDTENQDCTFAFIATLIEKGKYPFEMEDLEKIMSYDDEEGLRGFRERFQYGTEGVVPQVLLEEMKSLAGKILEITELESKQWKE